MTSHLIHRDQYAEIWRHEKVDPKIIADTVKLYEYLPRDVVYTVAIDDVWAGIPPFQIKYTDEDVEFHDRRFRLKHMGYPIAGNLKTNTDLAIGESERIIKNIAIIPLLISIGVIGSIGGIIRWLTSQ